MRKLLTFTMAVLVAAVLPVAAMAQGAAKIPPRPEEITFGELTFDVPRGESYRHTLKNGVPVYVAEDHALPLVNVSITLRGGDYLDPADKVGLAAELVEAIRTRKEPVIVKEDEKVVHAVTTELTVKRKLDDETYKQAAEVLGEQTLLDLVTIIGFYTMVAVVLVGFDVDIPDGGDKPLAE